MQKTPLPPKPPSSQSKFLENNHPPCQSFFCLALFINKNVKFIFCKMYVCVESSIVSQRGRVEVDGLEMGRL